jgi:hypothetical protein
MYGNILSAVSQYLTPDLIAKIATAAGISDGRLARKAIGAAAPAILSGLADLGSSPEGVRQLADAIAKQSSDTVDNLPSTIADPGRLAGTGQTVLTSLLGGNSVSSLVSAISRFAGVGDGPVRSILGMLTPVILSLLGREAGAGTDGLTQFLSSQSDQISAAMPSGLSDALRTSGFLGRASPVTSQSSRANEGYRVAGEGADRTARARRSPASRSTNWAYWILPLLVIAGLLWYLLGGEPTTPIATAPETNPTPPSEQGARGNADLARRTTMAADSLSSTLQDVKDRASAVGALPKLQQATNELDRIDNLAKRLPLEARNQLAESIKTPIAHLKSALNNVNALPGMTDDVKSTIAGLQSKLDVLLVTPGSLAQQRSTPATHEAAYVATAPQGSASVRTYFDRDVYNNVGEKIGVVKDLVVGPDARIAAAVIGVGGFLGIGEKDVAVTFASLRVTQNDNDWRLVMDATKDALKEAPIYPTTNLDSRPTVGADPFRK